MLTAEQMAAMSPEQIAAYFAAQAAPANVKKPNIGKLFNQGANSSFPNITETYKCKFLRYEDITAGDGRKFKLIFVSATNSRDETQELSTIVQKATITADMASEIFVVNTTEQPDKRYPKVEAVED